MVVKVVQLMSYNLFSTYQFYLLFFKVFILVEENHIKKSHTSCLHEHNYMFNQIKPNLDMKFLCRLDNPIQKKSCQNKISHHCVCGLLFIVNLISSGIHRMNVTFYVQGILILCEFHQCEFDYCGFSKLSSHICLM